MAGSILVDKINEIAAYPRAGELTKILRARQSVGGCVPNVAIDLKALSPETEIFAVGRVGKDAEGEFVLRELSARGINVNGIKTDEERTSYTEVMSVAGSDRTFFTYAGASARFGYADVPFKDLQADMLHLGYFLLLDKVDGGDGLKILKEAKKRGIRTSVDLVSENSDRYASVLPCLAYADNVIINEVEGGRLAELPPSPENFCAIARKIKSYGVRERVIVHSPAVSVSFSENGFCAVPSYDLPEGFVKGATGAGDAFCAGALLGIRRGRNDDEILSFASSVAAGALSEADAVSGIKSERQIRALCKDLKRKEGYAC